MSRADHDAPAAGASQPASAFGAEIRRTATLAAPLIAGHVSTGLIGFVDAVIAGHHGTSTLAAVSIGTAMFWLPLMVPMGTLIALPALVSHHDGAGEHARIGPLFRQTLWLGLALGMAMWCLLTVLPFAMPAMGIAEAIRPGATEFVHAIRWGVPALALYLCNRYLCDGLHHTLPTMVFGFGGLLVLIPTGYALAFGVGGLPELGARGLGIASALIMWLQWLGSTLYLSRAPRFRALRLFDGWEPPRWGPIRDLLSTGLPIGLTWLMEGGLFVAAALLIGRLGEVSAAAHQIAVNVCSLCFMVPMGLAEATTVRVGHALGRDDRAGLRRAAFAGYALVIFTQGLSGAILLGANDAIVALYTADAAVATLAASLLLLAAAFQFPDGIQVLSAGALRGLKDTRIPMFLAAFSYWGIGMPLGAALTFGVGGFVAAQGPRGMWIGFVAGLSIAALLLTARFLRSSRYGPIVKSVGVTDGG